jgi:hypothetical protein
MLSNLEALDLSTNAIASVEGIRALSALPRLASLRLAGNPVCATVGYPACVMLVLPRLKQLDGCDRAAVTSGAGAGAGAGAGDGIGAVAGAAVSEEEGRAAGGLGAATATAAAAAVATATGARPSYQVQALTVQQLATTEQLEEKSVLVDRLQVRA